MGIKFKREYMAIINDLANSLNNISNFYHFIDMSDNQWAKLNKKEKNDCLKTLSDDIFYALAKNTSLKVGKAIIKYNQTQEIIKVFTKNKCIHIIYLN